MDKNKQNQKNTTSQQPFRGGGRGQRFEKAQDFKGTMKKLIVYLKPYYTRLSWLLYLR